MTMFWVSPPRFASCMPFRSTATRISARKTPSIEPAPPKMFTPPRTTAVTTSSSEPWAASARAEPKKPT